jgi:hypothetical protein
LRLDEVAATADTEDMKRACLVTLLTLAVLTFRPAPALADGTAFWGFSPTVTTRSTTGFSVGVSLLIVGFEFEYAHLNEATTAGAPGLNTYTFNALVMTPTRTQLYVTAGGGLFHESLATAGNTTVGVNVGGGVKVPLAGPIRLRVDYRVMTLSGSPITKTVQRFYFGANIAF